MSEIKIITPPVAESDIDLDLVNLTEFLVRSGRADETGGFLGGRFGYGAEFENDTFLMFPYYWGDCECGWAEKDYDAPHDEPCYQVELRSRQALAGVGFDYDAFKRGEPHSRREKSGLSYDEERAIEDRIYRDLTAKFDLPMAGCAVHCTCSWPERYRQWFDREKLGEEGHADTCLVIRPNFLHKRSGLRIDWYKWIGRDMEFKPSQPSPDEWRRIFQECVASLTAA